MQGMLRTVWLLRSGALTRSEGFLAAHRRGIAVEIADPLVHLRERDDEAVGFGGKETPAQQRRAVQPAVQAAERTARQEQIGRVGAYDEQHQADRTEGDPQTAPDIAHCVLAERHLHRRAAGRR